MPPSVYEHEAASPLLQRALKQTLPHSISLAYRTQHVNRTLDAHIFATFPPHAREIPHCWAAAYFDRSMRPETELWLFASGEIPRHCTAISNVDTPKFCPTCTMAIKSLLGHISTVPIPPLHPSYQPQLELAKSHEKDYPQTGPDARYPPSAGLYMRHLLLPSVVTLGACHHELVRICKESGLVRQEFPGPDAVLNKFLFNISNLPRTRELPEGLRWGQMREQDLDTVQARTSIPRTKRTLLTLKSVGVFEESTDRPVAWTFLGLDGSLTTLHTEPEFRGKGIAKAVAAKIIREYAPGLAVDEQGEGWAHADVYVDNVQSETVCRSLGGKPLWQIFWVRIDLQDASVLGQNGSRHRHE